MDININHGKTLRLSHNGKSLIIHFHENDDGVGVFRFELSDGKFAGSCRQLATVEFYKREILLRSMGGAIDVFRP